MLQCTITSNQECLAALLIDRIREIRGCTLQTAPHATAARDKFITQRSSLKANNNNCLKGTSLGLSTMLLYRCPFE